MCLDVSRCVYSRGDICVDVSVAVCVGGPEPPFYILLLNSEIQKILTTYSPKTSLHSISFDTAKDRRMQQALAS